MLPRIECDVSIRLGADVCLPCVYEPELTCHCARETPRVPLGFASYRRRRRTSDCVATSSSRTDARTRAVPSPGHHVRINDPSRSVIDHAKSWVVRRSVTPIPIDKLVAVRCSRGKQLGRNTSAAAAAAALIVFDEATQSCRIVIPETSAFHATPMRIGVD